MSQEIPTLIFHAQALKMIEELRLAYTGGVGTVDELVSQLQEALNGFQTNLGIPFFDFEPVAEGEPPLSEKINRLWQNLQYDINILQQQADISRASAVFTHNLISTEVMKARSANARLANKLKTLQLYSKAVDTSIVTFGDFFRSTEFLDLDRVPPEQQASLLGEGYVTLAQQGELVDLLETASVRVLPTSNGFLGNLHELSMRERVRRNTTNLAPVYITTQVITGTDRLGAPIVSAPRLVEGGGTTTWTEPIFRAEEEDRGQLSAIVDGKKDTWFEYEHCLISEADQRSANYFNFAFDNDVKPVSSGGDVRAAVISTIDWASGPKNGVLQLDLELDMTIIDNINYIVYTPFNLPDNSNYPVKVVHVQTSVDRTNWQKVLPENVYVGTTPNLQVAQHREMIVLGDAIWAFAGRPVRYIQFRLEQAHKIPARLGHLYYLDGAGRRVEGPNAPLSNPTLYYDPNIQSVGVDRYLQRREVFNGWRWVIGIADVSVRRLNHTWESTIITKPLRVGGIVDRVMLEADITIPEEYGDTQQWVSFYLSPDDGVNWYPISRIQDDANGIPEILAFNDPLPEELREVGVGYLNTPRAVTTLRLKAVLTRDEQLPSTTPVLHSYLLKVKRR